MAELERQYKEQRSISGSEEVANTWTALERELFMLTSQNTQPKLPWVQEEVLKPNSTMEKAHPFYPRYKKALACIPVEVTWVLLCLFEAHGGFEAVDMFMNEKKCLLKDVKWDEVTDPADQLEQLFLQWFHQVATANLWPCSCLTYSYHVLSTQVMIPSLPC